MDARDNRFYREKPNSLADEMVGFAKANAESATNKWDKETWQAHHRNCVKLRAEIERLRELIRELHESMQIEAGVHYRECDLGERVAAELGK